MRHRRGSKPASTRRRIALVAVLALGATFLQGQVSANAAPANLASFGIASASSAENAGVGPEKAIDGDPATRWSSSWSDPQSLTVDLGSAAHVTGVTLLWEAAYGKAYTVETSADGAAWTEAGSATASDGGTDEITGLDVTARYVRLTGTARATEYGYSLYELQVLGEFTAQAVSLAASSVRLAENGKATLPVRLNKASDQPVTVAYATTDGTALAGKDYQAANGTLTFPAGDTEQTITLTSIDDGLHESAKTFTLDLTNPTPAGTTVGPRGKATVTVADNDPLPYDGKTLAVADFQGGVPAELVGFGSDAANTPTLTSVDSTDRPGAPDGNKALKVDYAITAWGGITHTFAASQSWADVRRLLVLGQGHRLRPEHPVRGEGRRRGRQPLRAVRSHVHRRGRRLAQGAGAVQELQAAHQLPARRRPDRRQARPHRDVGLRGEPAGRERLAGDRPGRGVRAAADHRQVRG